MLASYDVGEFRASPIGRCLITADFAMWCHSPDLQGAMLWGVPDERTIHALFDAGRYIDHPAITSPRRTLTDCSGIERADIVAVSHFIAIGRRETTAWRRGLERQALVVPAGFDGVMVAGALTMPGVEHALRVVHDVPDALAFIDHPGAAYAHATVTALVSAHRGSPAVLARLRAHLARNLVFATAESSAAALGMSMRTLQRELQGLQTSFSEQLRQVRLAAAERLLVHSDLKIEAVATQVGLGTSSRMSELLRRDLQMTASELRATRSK
jgi:AraC-like DNA-binding protein